jgi:hypothetical protein
MEPTTAEHARTAIFAANGPARHRLGRAAIAAGVALLAAWLVALALGAMGGFDSLPVLPSSRADGSKQGAVAQHQHQQAAAATPDRAPTTADRSGGGQASAPGGAADTSPPATSPKPSATAPAPAAAPGASSTANGQALGTTKPQGKPAGSPGNGPGGTGPPGQLR